MSSPSPADSIPLGFQVDFNAQYAGIKTFTYGVNHHLTSPASPDLSNTFAGFHVSSSSELYYHGLDPPFAFPSPATSETSTFVAPLSSTTSNAPSPSPSPPRKPTKAARRPRKAAHKASPRNDLRRVVRSPNAFMLFRRHVLADRPTMLEKLEAGRGGLNELVGSMWREKTVREREPWFAAAAAERRMHEETHPGFEFAPVVRDRVVRRARRREEAEEDRVKEPARMISEDRLEEEILAIAALHARHIASLSQPEQDKRREGKERVAVAPVAEEQIEATTSDTLVRALEPAVSVVADVELAAPMMTSNLLASILWPYDI